ncbi:hypothetical protein [Enterococcus olivae]
MSKKFVKALTKIAEETNLSVDKQLALIFGEFNGYTLCLIPYNESYTFTLQLSLSQNSELPDADLLKRVVSESKIISACTVQGHQVNYTLKTGLTANKSTEKLREALEIITDFLKDQRMVSCCQICGAEGTEAVYNLAGVPTICCEDCFKAQQSTLSATTNEKKQRKENLIGGLVGALLGSLLGVATIVVLGQLGYVAALSGIVLAVCTLKGYELLGGQLSSQGIIGSTVIMIIMVYFGTRLDWSISVASYYEDVDIVYAFQILPDLIREGFIEGSSFYADLGLSYLFTALGAIPTIINILRNRKLQTESYKMTGSNDR